VEATNILLEQETMNADKTGTELPATALRPRLESHGPPLLIVGLHGYYAFETKAPGPYLQSN
jgi:hypothetical protein